MIGLMGVGNYGELYSPKGKYIMSVPFGRGYGWKMRVAMWIARNIQVMQHWIAQKTWK